MELQELRNAIDELDHQLIDVLERRMDVSAKIAAYKLDRGIPILDAAREEEKLSAVRAVCRPETGYLIDNVFRSVLAASRTYQAALMEKKHA